jgi:hypothetical protein
VLILPEGPAEPKLGDTWVLNCILTASFSMLIESEWFGMTESDMLALI